MLWIVICGSRWKISHNKPFRPLMLNKMSNKSWKNISIDLIAQVKSYNTIYVIVDKLIKRAHFIPIDIHFLSKDMVQLLNDGVYSLHKLLLQIISDKEIQYLAEIFWKKYKLLN